MTYFGGHEIYSKTVENLNCGLKYGIFCMKQLSKILIKNVSISKKIMKISHE